MSFPVSIFTTRATDALGLKTDGVAVSSTDTYYSAVFGAANAEGQSVQLQWTGTPNGTFTLWHANKPFPSLTDDSDWVEDTTFSPTNPTGTSGKFEDSADNMKAHLKRIKYVNSSGSGVLYGWATVVR